MTCNEMNSKLPDLLFESEELNAAVTNDASLNETQAHLAECSDCREQLAELRATMALLDTWEAPEPNPYFLTRLNARLDEEREAAPAGWFERVRARFVYGSRWSVRSMRPVAAMAMTLALLVSGGAYISLSNGGLFSGQSDQPNQAAVVHDLQTLDNNAQLLDQLESLSNQNND